jgi:hypothetical protein
MNRRTEQLKNAGSLLGALFLGTSKQQRRAIDTIAQDVESQLQDTRAVDDEAIVVEGELVEDEEEDDP